MTAQVRTPEEIRSIGLKALAAALGPEGMARFILQFDRGQGDYTAARQAWVDHADLDALLGAARLPLRKRRPLEGTTPGRA
jgi:hypothetical protein